MATNPPPKIVEIIASTAPEVVSVPVSAYDMNLSSDAEKFMLISLCSI